jgi:serine/threonine protein phosphatase 1
MLSALGKLLKRDRHAPAVPDHTRVYAVGDVHGRVDLLDMLHMRILEDAASYPDARKVAVFLGDFIDRGLHSREVIDRLIDSPLEGFERVHLKGNHEAMLLKFLKDPKIGPNWLKWGGNATLLSYSVSVAGGFKTADAFIEAREMLRRNLPARHLEFLRQLALTHVEGDYLFVHAGVRPGVELDRQVEKDLLWIREPFLSSTQWHGRMIVHGHTISGEPETTSSRIGIDTAAYATGTLTCLALSGEERDFLVAG